jgi:hypothetical protein
VQPEHPTASLASVFRQLRFLNLVNLPEGYDLTWTMFILKAAPLLKELYMTVCALPKDLLLPRGLNVRLCSFLSPDAYICFIDNLVIPFSYCWHAGMGSWVCNGNG